MASRFPDRLRLRPARTAHTDMVSPPTAAGPRAQTAARLRDERRAALTAEKLQIRANALAKAHLLDGTVGGFVAHMTGLSRDRVDALGGVPEGDIR